VAFWKQELGEFVALSILELCYSAS